MNGGFNIQCAPTPSLWAGGAVDNPPPIGSQLLAEDGSVLLNEDGSPLLPE